MREETFMKGILDVDLTELLKIKWRKTETLWMKDIKDKDEPVRIRWGVCT